MGALGFFLVSWLVVVTSIIPHLCGIILMITIIEMKEDLCNFPMKKRSTKSCNFWKNATFEKDVWLVVLFTYAKMEMLKLECSKVLQKLWYFYYRYISLWYWCVIFFQIFLRCRKKDMRMWSDGPTCLLHSQKIH